VINSLNQAINFFALEVNETQKQQLLTYVNLIEKWNKTYNLTAIKTKEAILNQHIVDSLSIIPFIKNSTLLDIGSGAGLPGIVIAIVNPNVQVSVLDSVGKKCIFMQFVKAQLQLDNLNVINKRVEDYQTDCFAQIISRAFASIEKTLEISQHLLCPKGIYLLMKGDNFHKENTLNKNIISHQLTVPNVSNKRYLLEIKSNKV
jgi:16S rRNA (guanine527-N7)-methyltransferase